jgi:hypothetical protein
MEKLYEKNVKEQTITQYQPEASAPLAYENELSQEEKENIFKDIYSCIKLFDRLLYEAKGIPNKVTKKC